jgi:hypothetical protein
VWRMRSGVVEDAQNNLSDRIGCGFDPEQTRATSRRSGGRCGLPCVAEAIRTGGCNFDLNFCTITNSE